MYKIIIKIENKHAEITIPEGLLMDKNLELEEIASEIAYNLARIQKDERKKKEELKKLIKDLLN